MVFELENRFRVLARCLNEVGVRYSVFKGFPNLQTQSWDSVGDIDVLVHEKDALTFSKQAQQIGFLNDQTSPEALGNHVTVWRTFDRVSARFLMVHAYFKLCVSHSPPLRLGIEELILEQSSLSDEIRIAPPETRLFLSYCFKILAGEIDVVPTFQLDSPDVRLISNSLVKQLGNDKPTDIVELGGLLGPIAQQHATQSACKSNDLKAAKKIWLMHRLFKRNKLGKGLIFSVHSDGNPDGEQSIKLAARMMSEVMPIRVFEMKTGIMGQIIGSFVSMRSYIAKRRGFLVMIREPRPIPHRVETTIAQQIVADIFVDIQSMNNQVRLTIKPGKDEPLIETTHINSNEAGVEIIDTLVNTIAKQRQ